jgi:hypothetical protein
MNARGRQGICAIVAPTPADDMKTSRRTPAARIASTTLGMPRAMSPVERNEVPTPSALITASWPRAASASLPAPSVTLPVTTRTRPGWTPSRAGSRTNSVTSSPRSRAWETTSRPVAPVAPRTSSFTAAARGAATTS